MTTKKSLHPSKTLIMWDVGALLLQLDYGTFYEKAAPYAKLTPEEFKDWFVNSKVEEKALVGKYTKQEVYNILAKKLQLSPDMVSSIAKYAWPRPIADILAIKEQLRHAGYATGYYQI